MGIFCPPSQTRSAVGGPPLPPVFPRASPSPRITLIIAWNNIPLSRPARRSNQPQLAHKWTKTPGSSFRKLNHRPSNRIG